MTKCDCLNKAPVVVTWSDGATTEFCQSSIDRYIALYGAPKFAYARKGGQS